MLTRNHAPLITFSFIRAQNQLHYLVYWPQNGSHKTTLRNKYSIPSELLIPDRVSRFTKIQFHDENLPGNCFPYNSNPNIPFSSKWVCLDPTMASASSLTDNPYQINHIFSLNWFSHRRTGKSGDPPFKLLHIQTRVFKLSQFTP